MISLPISKLNYPMDISMKKENIKIVGKVWGREEWLVNGSLYCGKILHVDEGAESSYHYHKKKLETFYALEGQVILTIEGKDYMLNLSSRPKTIEPNERHMFYGITKAKIIEFSTHHDDEDVFRLTESKSGNDNKCY